MNFLFLIGLVLILGAFGGKVFQKIKIPQVVGYILVGLFLGSSGFGILDEPVVELFNPLINIALGLIGFRIGAELKLEVFKKYGRSIYSILLSEGLLAFIIVALLVTWLTKKPYLGLLLGALASATDPAATTDVLWEYKAKGPLTSNLLGVIALDDGLALVIYGFASVFAKSMMAHSEFAIFHSIFVPLFELLKSCFVGVLIGYGLFWLVRLLKDDKYNFIFTLASIIFTLGLTIAFELDFILASMALGTTFVNLVGSRGKNVFKAIEGFSPPIYILFFTLVGAKFELSSLLYKSLMVLGVVYLGGRTLGKMAGAFLGSWASGASMTVRKYLGLCLFSQAGVAIGLAMIIYHNFSLLGPEGEKIGLVVVNVITATTFIAQIVGPPSVKYAVIKAKEDFKNITQDDIVDSLKVSDVMGKSFYTIKENSTFPQIVEAIKKNDTYHLPVVNKNNELTGMISFKGLKDALYEEELNSILVAEDLAEPLDDILCPGQPLRYAYDLFKTKTVEYLPVTQNEGSKNIVGMLEYHDLLETINRKLIEKQAEL